MPGNHARPASPKIGFDRSNIAASPPRATLHSAPRDSLVIRPMASAATTPTSITVITPRPNRSCSRIITGLSTRTPAYTARNHSGPNGIVAPGGRIPRRKGVVGSPTSNRWSPSWITAHTPTNTRLGRRRRASRVRTNSQVESPRRRNARYVTRFENPPTKKKIGMTWRNHVAIHSHGVRPIALVEPMTPSSQKITPISQWPTTTTGCSAPAGSPRTGREWRVWPRRARRAGSACPYCDDRAGPPGTVAAVIDLHAHTTYSDGTFTPEELVALARERGLTVLAVTDHDSTEGLPRAFAAADDRPQIVPGVEFSAVRDGHGIHVLAYWIDLDDEVFQAELRRLRDDRFARGEAMVRKLRELGYPITFERVREIAEGKNIVRPHIAQALVEAGVVDTIEDAFTPELIKDGGRAYVEKHALDPVNAVRLIKRAGGLAVVAHPGLHREGLGVADDVIEELAAVGLHGIEGPP